VDKGVGAYSGASHWYKQLPLQFGSQWREGLAWKAEALSYNSTPSITFFPLYAGNHAG